LDVCGRAVNVVVVVCRRSAFFFFLWWLPRPGFFLWEVEKLAASSPPSESKVCEKLGYDQSVGFATACVTVFAEGLGPHGPIFLPSHGPARPYNSGQMAASRPHFSAQVATLFGAANHIKLSDEFIYTPRRKHHCFKFVMQIPFPVHSINQLSTKCRGYAQANLSEYV